jgi:hypothetical protein
MSDVKAETRLAKVVHIGDSGFTGGIVGPRDVVINRGSRQGVKLRDRFLIFGFGPHIVDPDTGEDLGELEVVRGQGAVVRVQEHVATVRTLARSRTRPPKRIIRQAYGGFGLGTPGNVIEEELAPEAEVPFEAVCLGDLAKPI